MGKRKKNDNNRRTITDRNSVADGGIETRMECRRCGKTKRKVIATKAVPDGLLPDGHGGFIKGYTRIYVKCLARGCGQVQAVRRPLTE